MSYHFALAGNPNCGKTTLFNHLTGSTAHVGNWPGVTVDVREGKWQGGKKRASGSGRDVFIVDLPGIYSLSPYSPEEVVSRNYILSGNPDVVINIVDATNLERNLYLSTQIMEMDTPMVIALNMMDVVEKNGDRIDIAALEEALGVPVIPIAASRGEGIEPLMAAAIGAANRRQAVAAGRGDRSGALATAPQTASSVLEQSVLGESIGEIRDVFEKNGVAHPLYYAVKMLEGDEEAFRGSFINDGVLKKVRNIAQRVRAALGDVEAAVADGRYQYITKHYSPYLKKGQRSEVAQSNRIDAVLTHRVWGIPIFLLIMFLIFHLTFSENLFSLEGVPALGTWLAGIVEGLVEVGTEAVAAALESAGASSWAQSLLVDGVLAGVGAVIGFIPLVLVLYLFIQILEDTGYMARAAFIMDRLLRKFGISGRSFVPLMMGFGCSVPAISATKTLVNERDRRITIMLIPFMSCGAKIPVYALIIPAFFPDKADLVISGFYLFGIIVALLAGLVLKKTMFKGSVSPFILELPPYRIPTIKSLSIHLWEKVKDFAVRVGVVITLSTIIIWFLSSFGNTGAGFGMLEEPNSSGSVLGILGNGLRFLFAPLGFAADPMNGWKAVVAVLTGLVAREAVVSTMGQLYSSGIGDVLESDAAGAAFTAVIAATFSAPAALALLTWNLFSTPCMAAVGAIRSEMNSRKWFWVTMAFHFVVAWVMAFLVFHISSMFIR